MNPMKVGRLGRVTSGLAAIVLATAGVVGTAHGAAEPQFFDWTVPADDGGANFTPAPFLNDSNVNDVAAFLAARQAQDPTAPLAVKVIGDLTSEAAIRLFDTFPINYVFADFEGDRALAQTRILADVVHNSLASSKAFVGNFNLYPGNDDTRPSTGPNSDGGTSSFDRVFNQLDYQFSHANMANPALYPGSPDFRTPLAGNSNSPNIRSALFVLPIQRLSEAKQMLPTGHALVPWVERFNNAGNPLFDTDQNSANGYQFVQNAADPADGQLLSRGDFEAQILHYRLRGATSLSLFNSNGDAGVVGYTPQMQRDDAVAGWTASSLVNTIFARGNAGLASLDLQAITDPFVKQTSEATGVVWSGVYDTKIAAGGTRQLAVLLSNLGNIPQEIDILSVGGIVTFDPNSPTAAHGMGDDYDIAPGTHRLLSFNLKGNRWVLFSNEEVFTDHNRNGVGIPEPTSISLLGMGAAGLLLRRRSRR